MPTTLEGDPMALRAHHFHVVANIANPVARRSFPTGSFALECGPMTDYGGQRLQKAGSTRPRARQSHR